MNSLKLKISTIIAAAAVIGVPAVSALAQDYDGNNGNAVPAQQPAPEQATMLRQSNSYFTVEGFYAGAKDDIYYDGEELNIGGVWCTVGAKNAINPGLSLDCAGIIAFGGGSLEVDEYEYGYWGDGWNYYPWSDKNEWEFNQYDLFLGVQLGLEFRPIERLGIGIGVMGGLDIRYADFDYDDGYESTDDDDATIGWFYGVYARAQWDITQHWGLTASVRYMATTTESEFSAWGENVKLDSTDYLVGTLGLVFSF